MVPGAGTDPASGKLYTTDRSVVRWLYICRVVGHDQRELSEPEGARTHLPGIHLLSVFFFYNNARFNPKGDEIIPY